MQPYFKPTQPVICVPGCPVAMLNVQQLIFIRDQLCRLLSVLECRVFGHSGGMQSFISPVDHYAALLCDLQRAQWVFEQFLSTLKAALPQSECLLTLFLCSTPPPLTSLLAAQIQLTNCFQAVHLCFFFTLL